MFYKKLTTIIVVLIESPTSKQNLYDLYQTTCKKFQKIPKKVQGSLNNHFDKKIRQKLQKFVICHSINCV